MSVIDKSVQLGKDLFEINRKTAREIVAIQIGGVRRYIETNVGALRQVGEIRSLPAFAEAQKTYNATLLAGVQSDLLAGREVVKEAVADTRAAFQAVRAEAPKKTTRAAKSTGKTTAKKTTAPRKRRAPAKKAA